MNWIVVDEVHEYLIHYLTESQTLIYDPTIGYKELITNHSTVEGIIIRSSFKIDKNLIDALPNLRCIARYGAGMENIDKEYAISKNIMCINAAEGNATSVAEQCLGMLLSLLHQLPKATNEVKNGVWDRQNNWGSELTNKTIAIIGFGNTGSQFYKLLQGFSIKKLIYDPYKNLDTTEQVDYPTIFEEADIVSLHIPLTPETHYLVNKEYISKFKKNIILLNTSRGKIVDTQEIAAGIASKKIKAAALDVLEYEKLNFENLDNYPTALSYLLEQPNVMITPHIAGWSQESYYKMAEVIVKKIKNLV